MRLLDKRLPASDRRVALCRVEQLLKLFGQCFGENVDLIEADRARDSHQMLGGLTDEALTLLSEAIRGLGSLEQIASIQQADALRPQIARDSKRVLLLCLGAKRQRLPVALYNALHEASRLQHLSLLSDLQDAVAQGQLRQFLQPKISPQDGRLVGAEALVRWAHPLRGWPPPSEFVPFAEETGCRRFCCS